MARISEQKRAEILADLQAGKESQAEIAHRHGVSTSSVRRIAREPASPPPKRFNAKEARAQLIQDLYEDAQRLRERSWSPYTQVVVGGSGPELVTTRLPPLRDQQAGYTSAVACINQALRLEQADTGDSTAEAKSLLSGLADALGVAANALE